MYGYWDRKDENTGSFVNKVDGLAKLAGIIGLGVASRPYWSRLTGRASTAIAERLGGKLTGTSIRAAVADVMGEEFNLPFFKLPEEFRKHVASVVTRQKRLDVFFNELETNVDKSSIQTFREHIGEFRSQASIFGKIGSVEDTDVDNIVLNSRAMRKLKSVMEDRGVKFEESFNRDFKRRFEEIAAKTASITPDREAIDEYLSKADNQKELQRAFSTFLEKQQERVQSIGKFIDISDQYEHITGADLLAGGQRAQAVNTYLKRIGVKSDAPVEEMIQEAMKLHHGDGTTGGLFTAPTEAMRNTSLKTQFENHLKGLKTTGLIINKETGDVVSLARLRNERVSYTNALLDELQIPLIPFRAGVPLKIFKFMKPTDSVLRNLGNIGLEPELRREFLRNGYTREQLGQLQGLGIGDHLATFSEDGSIRYHDKGFKRIISYERRRNQNIASLLNVRDQDPMNFRTYARNFGGAEDNYSKVNKSITNVLPKISEIRYDADRGGFLVRPKENANAAQVALINSIYKQDELVDLEMLHPTQLAEWLSTQDGNTIASMGHDAKYALRYVLQEASQDRRNMSGFLQTLQPYVASNSPFNKYVSAMLDNAGDPKKLRGIIEQIDYDVSAGTEKLYTQVSPSFFRAISTFSKNLESLHEVTQGEAGLVNTLKSDFVGQSGIGAGFEKLQEAMLSQVMREHSIEQLAAQMAGGSSTAEDIVLSLQSLRTALMNGDPVPLSNVKGGDALLPRLFRLGLSEEDGSFVGADTISLIDSIVDSNGRINRDQLGKFALATLDDSSRARWLSLTNNFTEKAKMIQDMAEAANALDVLQKTDVGLNSHLQILSDLGKDLDVAGVLKQRFGTTKPWKPRDLDLSPLNINNYYTVTSQFPSIVDLINNPGDILPTLKSQASRLFGVQNYISGLVDPNAPLGPLGVATQMLVNMPQHIANEVGLGLRGQDRITTLRTAVGFYGKRVLPLVVGHEIYKNFNANMHAIGLPGLDDMGANLLANVNLNAATIKDALGVTSINQWAVNTMPGLDQYFSPRSREEYEEYLKYGDEEVRYGRGWLYGSRTPLTGEHIKYSRPNFFRRWKSHWTEASNVDISNPYYSFLPNLQNPLAPLSLLLNPDWWEEKHRSDRPYLPGGVGTYAPADWARHKDYISINSQGNYGALGIAEIGGGYPTSMVGGGYSILYDMKSDSLVTGAQGTGGGASRGPSINAYSAMGTYYGVNQSHSFGLEAAGSPIRLNFHEGLSPRSLPRFNISDIATNAIQAVRTQAGMHGAILSRMPFYPEDNIGYVRQTAGAARSFSRQAWMGEYGEMPFGALGTTKEFFRRFITADSEGYDAYNPLPNNMPSWLPDKFKTGDPYMRTPGIGELQLPGEAWERTHPWVTPLKVRGSAIGLSEKELIQKWLNPLEEIEDPNAEDIVEFGSAVHLGVQRQLRQIGALVGAEVSIYNKEHNFSGTVDAIVRGANGLEILEIKTQGSKSWGTTPDKYIDQLTFYMATTGIESGKIAFINRDNPDQVRIEDYKFDPYRFQNIVNRVERARATMTDLIGSGMISPFESYDLVSRIEILAKVAPGSPEFRDHVEHALKGGLGGFEKQRVEQAVQQAQAQSESYRLYPKRYGVDLAKAKLKVEGIGSNGEIITDHGVVKLAGVDFDPQAFAFEDASSVLGQFGINVGENITVKLMKGQLNDETMADMVTPVIVGNVNQELVNKGFATWDESTNSNPVASQARYGNQLIGSLWESIVHSDNLITNKFMRVRTALEQFERGEVFGTDDAKWSDPIGTLVAPTINSLISKDPLTATAQGAVVGAMFARTNTNISKLPYLRNKLAVGGGLIAGTLALIRGVKEAAGDSIWTPTRYRQQSSFDEYWDIIKYLKYTSIAESAKKLARTREKVDIDKLRDGERETVGLGPYAVLAIDAERRAKRTMYGFDVFSGSLQDAISSLPKRQQQIAQSIVESGTLEEKQRFYDLLPDAQRRVLGKFLGVNRQDLPLAPDLTNFFQTHFLPNVDWGGWSRSVDLNDLKNRSAAMEGVKVDKPNRAKVSKARTNTNSIAIPRMDNPTYGDIRRQINNLLSSGGYHNINVDLQIMPSDSTVVNVDMDLFEDQTQELIDQYRRDGV